MLAHKSNETAGAIPRPTGLFRYSMQNRHIPRHGDRKQAFSCGRRGTAQAVDEESKCWRTNQTKRREQSPALPGFSDSIDSEPLKRKIEPSKPKIDLQDAKLTSKTQKLNLQDVKIPP